MLRVSIIALCAFAVVHCRPAKRQEFDNGLEFFGESSDRFENFEQLAGESAQQHADSGHGGSGGGGGGGGGGNGGGGGGNGGSSGGGSGGGGKIGYSAGSGLRAIAQGSADQANNAVNNQHIAAAQAAYVAKNTLAQAAAAASATAQAALAGKTVILQGLQQQVRDAKVGLQGESQQLVQAQRSAAASAQASQQAQQHVNVLTAALNVAQTTADNANQAAAESAGELAAQVAMVGAAKQRLQVLTEQLQGVTIDFQATQAAALKAMQAAQTAQANAARAAADANFHLEAPPPAQGGNNGGGGDEHSAALTAEIYDSYNGGYHY